MVDSLRADGDQKGVLPTGESALFDEQNIVYEAVDEEPKLHVRTYVALFAMFLLNLVQVVALQGPPAVLPYIGSSLNNTPAQTWVPNSLSLVQAVLGPIISSTSDTFQARKSILIGSCMISFVGAAIAPGARSIYRLIVAQTLIGVGFASVPLAYCVPSEICPRRWRPMVQASMNIAATLGAIIGPMVIGDFTEKDRQGGWRKFYWFQMGLWGAIALGLLIGYKPAKRHTRLDHLSRWQKITALDLPGSALLTTGLTSFLTGLNLGGSLYPWTNARVLTTLILGALILVAFGVYESFGTSSGILHHDLFAGGKTQGRTFSICVSLIFIEGVLLFSYVIFYPTLTTSLFETDPLRLVGRQQPFWVCGAVSTVFWGYWSTRFRTIRDPLLCGFIIFTAGIVGFATVQPNQSVNALAFSGLSGFGFGAPLILIITGVQLSTPHHLIATATAVTTSARAVAATIFTAIYVAAFTARLDINLTAEITANALAAGLPPSSLPTFIEALVNNDSAALPNITGVTSSIIAAGVTGLKQAFADSIRVVYVIAAPFGLVASVACLFIGDLGKTMNYRVDAPLEELRPKQSSVNAPSTPHTNGPNAPT
ncbi:hypothetical protein LTR84_004231 [Exophiala bonariae]|uniref:Major facilitator superfamily (MFS) profile domain-containing protein n=1 Tax=Exophiala bonariae TaxID=1690606 RepID=A0AAV9N7K1_9EURO|nr:hypothetical protein LTR84_004231 [Exophiala bonariae]